jgi:hypothetical protein
MTNKFFQQKSRQWLILLLLTTFLSDLTAQTHAAQSYTKEERIYWLSMLWKDVSTKFHNSERLRQANWDSLYVANIEKAANTESDMEYYKLLEEFIAALNDGHSNISLWKCIYYDDRTDYLPVNICSIGGNYYVTETLIKNADDIPVGSKIIKINGLPTFEYLKKYIFQYIPAQTKQDKIKKALEYLNSRNMCDSIIFTVQTQEGIIRDVGMKYNWKYNDNEIIHAKFIFGGTDTFLQEDQFGKKCYRLRLDHFSRGNITGLIKKEADMIAQADYIILDLRHNRGGIEDEADTLLSCFLNMDTLTTYPSVVRIDDAYYATRGYGNGPGYDEYKDYYNNSATRVMPPSTMIKKDLPLFTQPLFVLISEKTYSAAEDFLITLKLHCPDRAILVGTPTGGSTGAPFVRPLPYHDAYYRICVRRPLLPEGMFENGIQPDYFYEPNIEELLNNPRVIDKYVAKLFSELKKK